MATYRTIASTETDPSAPLTAQLMKALEANPTAIAQGAAGAPRVDAINAMSHQGAVGAVGTWALLSLVSASAQIVAGTSYAGSTLRYAGFASSTASAPFSADYNTNGSTPSGTWLAMGTTPAATSTKNPVTLFLRIS